MENDTIGPTGVTLSGNQDVAVGSDVIGRDKITNISINSLQDLILLAHGLGDLGASRDLAKRQQWDRIADYLFQIATTLEQASAQMQEHRAPYREFIMLQRYAADFRRVASAAFSGTREQDVQKFKQLLHNSISTIVGFDIAVLKFSGLPIPGDLYSSKAGLLRQPESVENPPLEQAHFFEGAPTIAELQEAAAVFKAEAYRIRAST